MKLYYILFLFTLSCSFTVQAQNDEMDSIPANILKSVQQKLAEKGLGGINFFDTSLFLSGLASKNLSQVFEELNKGLSVAKSMGDVSKLQKGYYNLSTIDSLRGNYKGAYENYKLYSLYHDSLQKKETEKKELQAKLQYEFNKKQAVAKAEQDKKDAEQKRIKNLQYFTIAGLTVLVLVILLIALIQWRNNNQKKKVNVLLQLQNERAESALTELKSTQTQLIQSEKMASLGELTAGIAHEIQNPLNFVNNFSEVNKELVDELQSELKAGNAQEAIVISNDIKENEEKINHHGKRADAIVKGMLQHSRSRLSQKEPADINALADEYLRLSYHGLRAKDKDFNATLRTDFDKSISKINIIPEDIGRMLLNLFTNAFYSVTEKKKQLGDSYEPTVSVTTETFKSLSGELGVLIVVADNGTGIPQKVLEKIYQPFFTTKPTGQGTGLGLSLSYDTVKAHNGDINVETKEGEYAKFFIHLPYQ